MNEKTNLITELKGKTILKEKNQVKELEIRHKAF
jgi:hypothetical protein